MDVFNISINSLGNDQLDPTLFTFESPSRFSVKRSVKQIVLSLELSIRYVPILLSTYLA